MNVMVSETFIILIPNIITTIMIMTIMMILRITTVIRIIIL